MSTASIETRTVTDSATDRPALIQSDVDGHVGVVRLNRPKVLNALNPELMDQLADQMEAWDQDPDVHVIVLTGNERAFAAGADVVDMADRSTTEMYERNQFATWDRIQRVRTPIIAAVSGFALGGGCELMMLCDIVIAGADAQFGQPEINLGVIPGAGGTQRLPRAIGKAQAMDLILTGRFLTAHEAHRAGLVSRVVPPEHCLSEALRIAHEMAAKGSVALRVAKESVLKAFESPLSEGIDFERKMFYILFSTEDQKEGMRAFAEKRRPQFRGK